MRSEVPFIITSLLFGQSLCLKKKSGGIQLGIDISKHLGESGASPKSFFTPGVQFKPITAWEGGGGDVGHVLFRAYKTLKTDGAVCMKAKCRFYEPELMVFHGSTGSTPTCSASRSERTPGWQRSRTRSSRT